MSQAIDRLEAALALDHDGLLRRPLTLLGAIRPASRSSDPRREALWRRLFLEPPLPYWHVARWALALTPGRLKAAVADADPNEWACLANSDATREKLLAELASRLDAFDPDLFPWVGAEEEPPARLKFVLGRELARSYVLAAIEEAGPLARAAVLLSHQAGWQEWIDAVAPGRPEGLAMACAIAQDALVRRRYTPGVYGVGKAHVLLEPQAVGHGSAAAAVTAELVPLDGAWAELDGLVVPDIRALGVLRLSDDFLQGVLRAWRLCRELYPGGAPTLLSFAVSPRYATVIDSVSGRSAETAVMAAIDSLFRGRMLRPNAAASASLRTPDPALPATDLPVEPVNFGQRKFDAARDLNLTTVVVHPHVAQEWRSLRGAARGVGPAVVPGELFRRDALPLLETRSLWRLALWAPLGAGAAFLVLTIFWQLYKASATPPNLPVAAVGASLPWVPPALLGSELVCLFLCVAIVAYCLRSIRVSLDSWRSSLVALGVASAIVLGAQFSPVGVRYEGLLDNPYHSVLFDEPQITAEAVSQGGGGGLLALHAIVQTVGFVTIQFGFTAFVIRLVQTRAHSEPLYEDRCELVRKDWRFSVAIFRAFAAVVLLFGLLRNTLWYLYLTTLDGVQLLSRAGGWAEVVAPLCGVTLVLLMSVGIVWVAVLGAYLARVVATSRGRAGYTAEDVVARLPFGARLLLRLRSGD